MKCLCNKNQLDALISQIYFGMKLYMFRIVPLSIIRNLFNVHPAMVYVIQVCRQPSSRTRMERVWSWSCLKAVWHIPLLSVQWINSWWWTEELSETCRVSCQNKYGKLVHPVFVMMCGHVNVKENHEVCHLKEFWEGKAFVKLCYFVVSGTKRLQWLQQWRAV